MIQCFHGCRLGAIFKVETRSCTKGARGRRAREKQSEKRLLSARDWYAKYLNCFTCTTVSRVGRCGQPKEKKIKTWLYCKGEGGQCLGAEVYFCVFGYEIIPVTSTD